MKKFPIALQLYSVRDAMAADMDATLQKVREMGYDGVEFAGLFGREPAQVADLCAKIGLTPISAHVAYNEQMSDPQKVLSDYAAIGCRYVALPSMPRELFQEFPTQQELVDNIRMLGRVAKEKGLQLLYHNHDFEFVKIDGTYALDRLYAAVDADLLATQLDTCWVHVAGEDPAAYVRRYTGRAPVVHLKDFVMPGKKPTRMYDLIGEKNDGAAQTEEEAFGFRPVGYGAQDIPAILAAAEAAGSEWMVVEQDQPSMGKTPMECAAMSIAYLKSL